MAFSYKQRECATCGGTLKYDKATKVYTCIYCGNTYDREESYDGQFSVRYAATQVLRALLEVDSSLNHWDLVQTNLNDCQKIDPSYPGSIVARLSASITRVRYLMSNREAVRTDLAQAQADYAKLPHPFDSQQHDVEADFYDGLESSDIRSLLISVFNTFKDSERVSYIRNGFDASDIRTESAANDLMNRAFSTGDYQQIDMLLQSPAKLDADALFARILNEYPEDQQKIDNICAVIMRGVDVQLCRDALSSYLVSSSDSTDTKLGISMGCVGRGVIPNGQALASFIGTMHDESCVLSLLSTVKSGVLNDEDISAVVDALLTKVGADAMAKGLNALAEDGYYLTFSQKSMISMLSRKDLQVQEKDSAFRAVSSIGLPEKRKQSIFSAYLAVSAPLEEKIQLVDMLATQISAINPMTVENYMIDNQTDGTGKAQMLAAMLKHVTARESLKIAAKRYAKSRCDTERIHKEIVKVLTDEDLIQPIGGTSAAGAPVSANALETYLDRTLGTPQYDLGVVNKLLAPNTRITERTLMRFLLLVPDDSTKAATAKRLINALDRASGHTTVTTTKDGHTIEAPILQIYLIANRDGTTTAQAIVPMLESLEPRINCRVIFDGNTMRFRKLVQSGMIAIPTSTRDYCASIRIF